MDDGIAINPDFEFWESKLGTVEVDELSWIWTKRQPKLLEYYSQHWVRKELYQKVAELANELEIPTKHLGDICIPLSHYPRTQRSMLGDDIKFVARDVRKLKDLFLTLNDPYKQVLYVAFQIGDISDYDEEKDEEIFVKKKVIKIKKDRAVVPFIDHLKRLSKTDESFGNFIHNSAYLDYVSHNPQQHFKISKMQLAVWLFEYLYKHKVFKTKRDSLITAGILLTLVDPKFLHSPEHFSAVYDLRSSYLDYRAYVDDQMKKRLKRHKNSKKGTKSLRK